MKNIDLHAVRLISDIAEVDGKTALMVWSALQPLIGHLQGEAVQSYKETLD